MRAQSQLSAWLLAIVLLAIMAGAVATDAVAFHDPPAPPPVPPPALGSVLVFPKFIKGSTDGGLKSKFSITVRCPAGQVCADGTTVKLLARWVCPPVSQKLRHKLICKEIDFELLGTVNSTLVFGAPNRVTTLDEGAQTRAQPIPAPPCKLGFLIVWVVSPDDADAPEAIKFDGLFGNAVLRRGPGVAAEYAALAIKAGTALANGALTDVNQDGRLAFDGIEYAQVTGQINGTVPLERTDPSIGRIETLLTLLTLDLISNRPNNPTFVDFHIEAGASLSVSHEFVCWSEVRLIDVDSNLNQSLGVQAGLESGDAEKVAIAGVDDARGPVSLIGLVERLERAPDSPSAPGAIIAGSASLLSNVGPGVPSSFEPN
jgi:hypothetical protein